MVVAQVAMRGIYVSTRRRPQVAAVKPLPGFRLTYLLCSDYGWPSKRDAECGSTLLFY